MEFQVYTVCLEDRVPNGIAAGQPRAGDVADEAGVPIAKTVEGVVAFVFGRTEHGKSVCVRVEGFKPKVYVLLDERTTLQTVKSAFERETNARVSVEERRFTHFYGYEPDSSQPSGRRVHRYAEVAFPSLSTFRAVCSARKAAELPKLRRRLADVLETGMDGERIVDDAWVDLTRRRIEAMVQRELPEDGNPDLCDIQEGSDLIDPLTRFLYEHDVTPSKWYRVPTCYADVRVTTCDFEVIAHRFERLERDLDAPYVTLYYDIETLGLDPEMAQVIQISLVFVQAGARDAHLVALGTVDPIPDVTIHACFGEDELLQTMRDLVVDKDPDFVVAYNGVNFDNRFLAVRAEKAHEETFWFMSRFALRKCRLRELQLSSSGMGDNLLRYIDMPGRSNLDWYVKLKRDLTSEPRYSLNHFAKKFCGDEKEDMHYREIPVLQRGSAADRARLGSYCVHDSVLLDRLNEARSMITEILQYCGVFHVIVEWIYFRGQQVRFVAQLLRKARTAEAVPMLMQRPVDGWRGEGAEGFEGATVNKPDIGFHKVHPVAVLDWKSLYPSIMQSHNLCHSTCVLDPAFHHAPGVVAHRVNDEYVTHFSAQHRGILPRILDELLAARAAARKELKRRANLAKQEAHMSAEHLAMVKVLDGRQLALKVACNSVYGACGAVEHGKIPCLDVSATTTAEGREAMVIKKTILPTKFPSVKVIYGDSVAGNTPLLLLVDGTRTILTAGDLWKSTGGPDVGDAKFAHFVERIHTWTENGWTPVRNVVRHRVEKAMYRVQTVWGAVDVTEDHSLLRADGTPTTAVDLENGTRLMHSWPTWTPEQNLACSPILARVAGLFVVTGAPREGRRWRLRHPDRTLLQKYCDLLMMETGVAYHIYEDTYESLTFWTLSSVGHVDDDLTDLLTRECYVPYDDGALQVPHRIINGSYDVMREFIVGVMDASAVVAKRMNLHEGEHYVDVAGERAALGVYAILKALGYNVLVGSVTRQLYGISWKNAGKLDADVGCRVLSVTRVASDEFVYDLTTDNHHFHAGVGSIIVHNTDSVMITFSDVTDVQTCGDVAARAAEFVTDHFVNTLQLKNMELEFEKCYFPYILESKKRYIGKKYEPDAQGVMVCKGIDAKGVETERRDTLPYTKEIMYAVRDALMNEMDEHKAIGAFRHLMDRLVRDEVGMEQLTMRKNLSSKVAEKTDTIVQARVNALKRQREAGSESAVNEQVEYVIVNRGTRKEKTTMLAEDPAYAKEHNLKLNRLWYFEHCIEDALRKIFSLLDAVDYERVCNEYRSKLESARMNVNVSAMERALQSGAASSSRPVLAAPPPPPPPPRPRKKK